MEKEEYIGRTKDDKDRRISYIILTEMGKNRIESLLVEGQKMSEDFSKEISDEEFVIFNRVLEKFINACKKSRITSYNVCYTKLLRSSSIFE